MIKKYIRRPFVVEAIEYTGDNLQEVLEFAGKHPNWEQWFTSFDEYKKYVEENGNVFKVISPLITKYAVPGDYIVRHPLDDIVEVHEPDAFKDMYTLHTLAQ